MSEQLRAQGNNISRHKARNLMKKAGVSHTYKKKFKRTTDSNHNLPVARNLLDYKFDVDKPNIIWCSGTTYLWTNEG
jgi:putative transposase